MDGKTQLNGAGKMVEGWWCELRNKFTNIELDRYVVMPNHFHGIIIVGADPPEADVCPRGKGEHVGSPLPKMVQWFKTMTTNEYVRGIRQDMYAPINKRLWQRNYYEHVVRNEDGLNCIREYILYNPLQWQFDRENPGRIEDKTYYNQWGHLEEAIYGKM